MAQEVFKTQHILTLDSGQRFITQAHTVSKNRMDDGVDVLYFETLSTQKPIAKNAQHYHTWNGGDEPLTAWMVPTSEVKEIIRK